MTLPSAESYKTTFDIDVMFEDEEGRPLDKSPLFFYVNSLLPYFIGKFAYTTQPSLLQNSSVGKKHIIRLVLSEELVPDALMQSLMPGHAEIRINLGLYLAFWALPSTISFLDKTIQRRSMALDELIAINIPDSLMEEIHQLLMAWQRSEESGWRETGFERLTLPRPNFIFPALVFIISHELGHYFQSVWNTKHKDPFTLAETLIHEVIESYMNSLPDEAAAVKDMFRDLDPKILEAWKREVAADQYAFFAIQERFDPSYAGERIPAVAGIVHEPTFQSISDTIKYAYIAVEMVFGLLKLLKLYPYVRGKPLSMETHPPVNLRREIFIRARARDLSIPLTEFIATRYGAGFITRVIMDKISTEYAIRRGPPASTS